MKKNIFYFTIGALIFGGIAYAAPSVIYQRHIRPETNSAWDLGASTSTWLGGYFTTASTTNLTISGLGNTGTECLQINNQGVVDNSGSGCGGGGGGAGFGKTWELNTDLVSISPTTTVGVLLTASSTFNRLFSRYASTTEATTTTLGILGTTTANSLFLASGKILGVGTTTTAYGELVAIKQTNNENSGLRISGSGTDDAFEFGIYFDDGATNRNWALFQAYNRKESRNIPVMFEGDEYRFNSTTTAGASASLLITRPTVNRTFLFPDWSGDFVIGTSTLNYASFNATSTTATSTLLDLKFIDAQGTSLSLSGGLTIGGRVLFVDGSATAPSIAFASEPGLGIIRNSTNVMSFVTGSAVEMFALTGSGIKMRSDAIFGWVASTNLTDGYDVAIVRDAANILAQRNGTNAQEFRVYNTYTSATNYELGKLEWASNIFNIGTEKGSGGGTARNLAFLTDSTERARIDTNGNFGIGTTSPSQALSVSGNTYITGSATTTNLYASNDFKVATTTLNGGAGWGFGIGTTTVVSAAQLVNTTASTTCNATCLVDWNKGTIARYTLTGNSTFTINNTTSNPIDGGKYILHVCQDGVGSRTVTFGTPANIRWGSQGTTTITSTALYCTFIGMIYAADTGIYSVVGSTTNILSR